MNRTPVIRELVVAPLGGGTIPPAPPVFPAAYLSPYQSNSPTPNPATFVSGTGDEGSATAIIYNATNGFGLDATDRMGAKLLVDAVEIPYISAFCPSDGWYEAYVLEDDFTRPLYATTGDDGALLDRGRAGGVKVRNGAMVVVRTSATYTVVDKLGRVRYLGYTP